MPATTTERDDPVWLTVEEARAILGVSRGTIYKWVQEGTIPSQRFGTQYRIPRSAVASMESSAGPSQSAALPPLGDPPWKHPDLSGHGRFGYDWAAYAEAWSIRSELRVLAQMIDDLARRIDARDDDRTPASPEGPRRRGRPPARQR